jgi:hypothetical protein
MGVVAFCYDDLTILTLLIVLLSLKKLWALITFVRINYYFDPTYCIVILNNYGHSCLTLFHTKLTILPYPIELSS